MPTAIAHANIALIKYWGKASAALNIPEAGSLSLTLEALSTRTTASPIDGLSDRLTLDGQAVSGRPLSRVSAFLDLIRAEVGSKQALHIQSDNHFPTAAGLASSASGFAALALAGTEALGLRLSPQALSALARRGSGSAARSIFGGFVRMHAGPVDAEAESYAEPIEDAKIPLHAVIAVAKSGPKTIGSTDGMEATRLTSPYHGAWISQVGRDLTAAEAALRGGDFEALAELAEGSCLAMHANAMAARPGIVYFQGVTLWAIETVRALRAAGTPVFFTVDAGPHVVAMTSPEAVPQVEAALLGHEGIDGVIRSGPGLGARLVPGQ